MKDLLQKVWFFGLGVIDATKEKVEGLVDEMIKRGEVTQQESPEVVEPDPEQGSRGSKSPGGEDQTGHCGDETGPGRGPGNPGKTGRGLGARD